MRRGSCAFGVLFLVVGHAAAAEPGTASPPAEGTTPAASKAPELTPAPVVPKAGAAPPPEYYVEPSGPPSDVAPAPVPQAAVPTAPGVPPGAPPPPSGAPQSGPPGPPPPPPSDPSAVPIFEPLPPGFYPPGEPVFEPPAPPEPHHVAPRTALWLGARVGLFVPFGSAFARGTADGAGNVNLKGVPWTNYVGTGPMFELDAGARLSRSYNVFALWERAQLSSGNGDPDDASIGKSMRGETDFWGGGIRATSNADNIGFVTELAVGYRRARAKYEGSEIQFTDAPFEARLGLGAEFRLNRYASLSPMFTLGVGSFGKIQRASKNGVADQMQRDDQADGHAWATFTIGGSFDLFGSKR
ncbi:MAG: hypothetical protein ABI548_20990 [Polyangiaceae bacterium]